jgi:hypothetical protein
MVAPSGDPVGSMLVRTLPNKPDESDDCEYHTYQATPAPRLYPSSTPVRATSTRALFRTQNPRHKRPRIRVLDVVHNVVLQIPHVGVVTYPVRPHDIRREAQSRQLIGSRVPAPDFFGCVLWRLEVLAEDGATDVIDAEAGVGSMSTRIRARLEGLIEDLWTERTWYLRPFTKYSPSLSSSSSPLRSME